MDKAQMTDRASAAEHKNIEMPSVLDRELSDKAKDAFGHQQYADALKDLIESPSNEPPFSIGLLGPWGTGKSTIKEFYRRELEADKSGSPGKRRPDRIHAITFNAWRFGGEQDLKRSLLREAFRQLGGDEAALRSELFEQVSKVVRKKRSFRDWFGEAFGQISGSAILFLLIFLGTLIISFLFVHFSGVTNQYTVTAIIVASVFAAGWLGKHVVDLRIRTPATYLPQTSISFPATSAEEYESLLTEQIETFRTQGGASCERLVVFVDDLDRLSAPEMVAGLDAIRTFLELPFNATKSAFGVVFVISCDEAKIAEALHRGRGSKGNADLPGSVFSRTDARRYLDRLFQFRLEIPLFPKQDMRQFALARLSDAGLVVDDLKARDVSLEAVIDRLIHVDVQSPRQAIQLLNAFIQSWWIGMQRERSGAGSSAHGVLHEGAVTDHPLSLAAMCVLRVDFPDFYECVQHRPEFLHEFRNVVFGTHDAESQTQVVQEIMSRFLAKDDDGKLTSDLQPEYRKLRQYLASVQDVRWAKRLQPLLRLAEDPVTRRYGDRAAAIHDALISGDVQGVLEGLRRDLDDGELSQDDATLIGDLTDTLPEETAARRINACRVLAGLVHRIPKASRRRLLTPVVRQMVELRPVRMNVGPSAARRIVEHALPVDRQEVAEQFISDLLHGEEIEWKNASEGSPNLDETTKLVRDTLDLALEVRAQYGLTDSADSRLRDWLLTRNVRVGGQTQTLPFSEFESLVSEHAAHLLAYLGANYSDQAISAFQSDMDEIASTEATLSRIGVVFTQLAQNGQEERGNLWSQLARLVSVPSIEADDSAWKTATKYHDLADAAQARRFLSAFAKRLAEHFENPGALEPDLSERGLAFNALLMQWQDHLDHETGIAIEPLISGWALSDDFTDLSTPSLNLLLAQAKPAWDESMRGSLQSDVAEMPPKSCFYIGQHAPSLTDENAAALIGQLDAIINRDPPEQGEAANHQEYVKSIPRESWSAQPWSDHLERLFTRTESMYGNAGFLKALFPSVMHLFRAAPDGRTTQLITQTFANATGSPDAYVVLHASMAGRWPSIDGQIGDYDPDAIVQSGCQFIERYPTTPDVGDVLRSLIDLSERRIASEAADGSIASVLPIVWRMDHLVLADNADFVSKALEPSQTADILNGAQPADLNQEDLTALLRLIADAYDDDALFDVLRALLEQQPESLFDTPDGALGEWLAATGHMSDVIAGRALDDDSFNDEQHRRVAAKVNDAFWVSRDMRCIETVLRRASAPNTRALLLERLQSISRQTLSGAKRSDFSSRLIDSLPSLSGDELANVAHALQTLGGKGALQSAGSVLADLDNDQRRTLRTVFPGANFLADIDTG